MRRKTDADISKQFIWLIALSLILIITGLLPYVVKPVEYGELKEKEVTVSSVRYVSGGEAGYYLLTTEDNEKFSITGDYDVSEMAHVLQHGKAATVKYYENKIFFRKYAEEITVGGKCVVSYTDNSDDTAAQILGIVSVVLGCGGLFLYHWEIKRNRALQAKRDMRIEKNTTKSR